VALVARSTLVLERIRDDIVASRGVATVHTFDLAVPANCTAAIAHVQSEHGRIDILINNAGRSIRRSIHDSLDRFHDIERTVQLNYFGPAALILASLGPMVEQRSGQIINVSSIGTQWPAPKFAAYVGSKAALEAFCRSVATEVLDDGVTLSTVYLPLVKTPMIGASEADIDKIPAWGPDQAAAMICGALVSRRPRVSTAIGLVGQVLLIAAPGTTERFMARTNRKDAVFSSSTGASGSDGSKSYIRLIAEVLRPTTAKRERAVTGH
jgi:short-subunit dehydrogenase